MYLLLPDEKQDAVAEQDVAEQKDAEQDVFEYDPSTQPSPHAGEDVPAYATGIGAEAVRGTLEQNALFEILKSVILP